MRQALRPVCRTDHASGPWSRPGMTMAFLRSGTCSKGKLLRDLDKQPLRRAATDQQLGWAHGSWRRNKGGDPGFCSHPSPMIGANTMRLILAALLTLPLAACGSSHNVSRASAAPPTVSFNVDDTRHMDEANDRAAQFCSRYNLPARLDSLDLQNGYYVARYSCG